MKHRQTMLPKVTKECTKKTPRHLYKVQTVRKWLIREMMFRYLCDDSKRLGSILLAAFQKGGIHCQKETIMLSRRLDYSFLSTASQMWLCLFTNFLSIQVFPALFPYDRLVCRSMGSREKNWTPSSCLYPCSLKDRKRWGQSTKLLKWNSSGKKKEKRQKDKKRCDVEPQALTPNPVFQHWSCKYSNGKMRRKLLTMRFCELTELLYENFWFFSPSASNLPTKTSLVKYTGTTIHLMESTIS